MNQAWVDAVSKVVRAAASKAVFPGDADPLVDTLHKLVQKLYSVCHNDGPLGADGCPVCRAFRTEIAEKAREAAEKALADAIKQHVDVGGQLTKALALKTELEAKAKALAALAEASAKEAKNALDLFKGAAQQAAEENKERSELAKHYAEAKALLKVASEDRDTFLSKLKAAKDAAKRIVEG